VADPLLRDVDLNLLPVLVALLEAQGVTAAARRLERTQSATSRALGRLRVLLDDELLVRVGRRMVLTPRAEALLPQVHRVIADARRMLDGPGAFDPETARATFRLAGADYVHAVVMPRLSARVRAAAPGVDLHVVPRDPEPRYLEDGELDVHIYVDGGMDAPDLMRTPMFDERFVTLLRQDHPVGRLDAEAYAALDHVLVAPRGRPGGIVDGALTARGLTRRVAVLVPSFGAAAAIVAATDLVVTLPERVGRLAARGLPLQILEPPVAVPPFQLAAFWHALRKDDPAHRWFRGQLRQVGEAIRSGGSRPERLSSRDETELT